MANQWFKFYGTEYLSDTKIASLSAPERSCWVTLLSLASASSIPGTIAFLTTETLLKKSGVEFDPYDTQEWDNSLGVLKKFERMKMIETKDNGTIEVLNWQKRQERPLTATERSRKFRLKQGQNEGNATNATKRNESATTEENRIDKNRIDKNKSVEETSPPTKAVRFTKKDMELSTLLWELIKERLPTTKKPNLDSWADVIRLMREQDNRTYEQIQFLINWSQQDNFWSGNILSTQALRKHFDKLVAQVKSKNSNEVKNILI